MNLNLYPAGRVCQTAGRKIRKCQVILPTSDSNPHLCQSCFQPHSLCTTLVQIISHLLATSHQQVNFLLFQIQNEVIWLTLKKKYISLTLRLYFCRTTGFVNCTFVMRQEDTAAVGAQGGFDVIQILLHLGQATPWKNIRDLRMVFFVSQTS